MKRNQISPIIIQFKALPGVKVVAVSDSVYGCSKCRLNRRPETEAACREQFSAPVRQNCVSGFHYEEVKK